MAIINSLTTEDNLKRNVTEGGGIWVGLQDTFIAGDEPLVLFNSPTSKSTLALPARLCTVANVRGKVHGSDADFQKRKISVPRSTLRNMSDSLHQLTTEIEDIMRGE